MVVFRSLLLRPSSKAWVLTPVSLRLQQMCLCFVRYRWWWWWWRWLEYNDDDDDDGAHNHDRFPGWMFSTVRHPLAKGRRSHPRELGLLHCQISPGFLQRIMIEIVDDMWSGLMNWNISTLLFKQALCFMSTLFFFWFPPNSTPGSTKLQQEWLWVGEVGAGVEAWELEWGKAG